MVEVETELEQRNLGRCDFDKKLITVQNGWAKLHAVFHEIAHAHSRESGSPLPNNDEELSVLFSMMIEKLIQCNGADVFDRILKWLAG